VNVAGIIQARTGSTRLPGKVCMTLAGVPFIQRVIRAVKAATMVQEVILAVPESDYGVLEPCARAEDCRIIGGPEDDVLERYLMAARLAGCDTIVRATGDNPFVCPEHIDTILRFHFSQDADLSHWLGIPIGTGVEVIRRDVLETAGREALLPEEREHVTPWIYAHRELYRVEEPDLLKDPGVRLTVDTAEDYARASRLAEYFHQRNMLPVRLDQVLEVYRADPGIFR